jgi:sRNA-binding protein
MVYKRNPEAERRRRQRQYQRLQPQIDAFYDEVFRRFPQTFFRAPQDVQPLKIGIFPELCDRIDAPRQVLKHVIRRYTRQRAYLQALAAGKPRLDLSGQAVETVSDSHRAHAQERLNRKLNQRRASRQRKAAHTAHEAPPPTTSSQAPAADALAASTSGAPQMSGCKSIATETITCLECGHTFKQLSSRHLGRHGLDTRSYRVKHGIPPSQPLAARATTERRRQLMREIRPWEKAPAYRKGQAQNGYLLPEADAKDLPEQTEAPVAAASAQPKRQRKTTPKKTARQQHTRR